MSKIKKDNGIKALCLDIEGYCILFIIFEPKINYMKKLLTLLTIAILFAGTGCNSTKMFTDSANKFMKEHNVQASVTPNAAKGTTSFYASIDSLYATEKLKAIAPQADIIYKVSDGKIILQGEAKGILDADKIAELYAAVIKAISFWKK